MDARAGLDGVSPVSWVVNLVGNHPTGPLDGIVFTKIVSQVWDDHKILTRELMTQMETDFGEYLITVPIWRDADALQ